MIVKESNNGKLIACVTSTDVINEFKNFNEFEISDAVANQLKNKVDFLADNRWKLVIGKYSGEADIVWEISDPSLQIQRIAVSGLSGHIELKNGLPVLS